MRIVIAGQTFNPATNGQGVFTIQLAEGLAQTGHQVMVVMPSDRIHAYRVSRNGVCIQAITAIPLAPPYSDVYVTPLPGAQVSRLLDEFRPDIVHIQDHYPLSRGVLHAALERELPIVGSNHFLPENITYHVPIFSRTPALRALLHGLLWKPVLDVLNQVDVVTTPTETGAAILHQQGIQVPVRVISCGVDLDRFRPDACVNRIELRLRYGLDPQRTIFLFVGRLDREKRLDVLIRAWHRLNRDDLQLAIAGRGRHTQALQALARQLMLGRRVVFTGYVPAEDLPALLNSVDIFAMPSEAELLSIATLEAMGTGRPVLAANAQALPELVENGVNGYLFRASNVEDAARCIAELADHPESWAAMGTASRRIVQRHSLSNTIQRYEELYRALLPPALQASSVGSILARSEGIGMGRCA
jgi:1,2-diacylglycerol 3-alpha-glucosyltransferase